MQSIWLMEIIINYYCFFFCYYSALRIQISEETKQTLAASVTSEEFLVEPRGFTDVKVFHRKKIYSDYLYESIYIYI